MFLSFTVLLVGVLDTMINSEEMLFNCSDALYYIQPNFEQKSWNEAQSICRQWNATLPIVSNKESLSCFASALTNFSLSAIDVWIGANSSGNLSLWRWINGSQYNGILTPNGSNQDNYAYVTGNLDTTILASKPTANFSYICRYTDLDFADCTNGLNNTVYILNNCFVKYEDKLSWFDARNRCLQNGGDLAYFSDPYLFSGLIDHEYWIGLRRNWWNWTDTVTGWTMDVTYTLWSSTQPDGNYPLCISTDQSDYISWRSSNCSSNMSFICQVSTPIPDEATNLQTPSSPTESVTVSVTQKGSSGGNAGDNRIALGVGLGVGIGVPLLILVVVVIVFLCRKRQKSKRKSNPDRKFEEKTELNTHSTIPVPQVEQSEGNYATVTCGNVEESLPSEPPSDTVTNYVELGFNNATSS